MKKLILLLLVVLAPHLAIAADQNTTLTVADNFLRYRQAVKIIISLTPLSLNLLAPGEPPLLVGYRADLSGGGYLLISASRQSLPIKSYSLASDFAALPPAYQDFLLRDMEAQARAQGQVRLPAAATTAAGTAWDFLLSLTAKHLPLAYAPDTWLLTSHWNQDYPYNRLLPLKDGQRVLAGCVNVAMAQVMRHHGYPASGKGVRVHDWNGQRLSANLYHPYPWDKMADTLSATTSEEGQLAVARLLSDLAIANQTAMGVNGSGTVINTATLLENFAYANTIDTVANSSPAFFPTIQTEVDNNRPLLLELPGHMAVVDGYSQDQTGNRIHINLGWGGADDSFYYFDRNLVTDGIIFPPQLTVYAGLQPCSGGTCVANLESGDGQSAGAITGRFHDYGVANLNDKPEAYRDVDLYPLELKGTVSISGSRGYSNQAFYLSLYADDGALLATSAEPLSLSGLALGHYTLRVSLKSEGAGYYSYNPAFADYTISISAPALTPADTAWLDSQRDHPPVLLNPLPDLILGANRPAPHDLILEARDADNDAITISARSLNTAAATVAVVGNRLQITPRLAGAASLITVRLEANGQASESSFAVLVAGQDIANGSEMVIPGLFSDQGDSHSHPVLLSGNCTIAGNNGFVNQAFYSGVKEQGGAYLVGPQDATIVQTFTPGLYQVTAALSNSPLSPRLQYPYQSGVSDSYWLFASCPGQTLSRGAVAGLLNVDLSGLNPVGDANGDGEINLVDAVLMLRAIAGFMPLGLSLQGDLTGSGRIDPGDVAAVLRLLGGGR